MKILFETSMDKMPDCCCSCFMDSFCCVILKCHRIAEPGEKHERPLRCPLINPSNLEFDPATGEVTDGGKAL